MDTEWEGTDHLSAVRREGRLLAGQAVSSRFSTPIAKSKVSSFMRKQPIIPEVLMLPFVDVTGESIGYLNLEFNGH